MTGVMVKIELDEYVVNNAVHRAIGAVLASIHGLPHGLDCKEAAEVATREIMTNGLAYYR